MGRPRKNPIVDKTSAKKAVKKLKTEVLKRIKNIPKMNETELAIVANHTPTIVLSEKTKKVSTDLMKDLLKVSGNEWGGVAADGIEAGDISGFMDTGSYTLNALVSGALVKGGFPNNKITVLAGEEATGKTFFVIECIKQFFKDNPTGIVMFFESESAISKDMLISRGIDVSRIVWLPVVTVQETRTQAVKILDKYLAVPKDKRIPMMFVLDSLGMLSTTKEIVDTEAGKETQDMTRAKLIKSMFRVLTLKLGRAGVPFLVTNHTYDEQGLFATRQMSGGCLVSGSKIQTPSYDIGKYDFDKQQIDNIKNGDCVNSYLGEQKVKNIFEFDSNDVYEIEFEDGFKVQCTGQHKFLHKDQYGEIFWVETENLNLGDILLKN